MKNRQYSLKVFETTIEDEDAFMEFFTTHQTLFKNHLIVINGEMSQTIASYLQNNAYYFLHNVTLPSGRASKIMQEELDAQQTSKEKNQQLQEERFEAFNALQTQVASLEEECNQAKEALNMQIVANRVNKERYQEEIEELSSKLSNPLTVLDTMVRSGTELDIRGDLLLLSRLNSGATVRTTGSLIMTQRAEGSIRCNGKFLMLSISPKANVVFNGVEVDNNLLKDGLNRIELKEGEIYITPMSKKEINWA